MAIIGSQKYWVVLRHVIYRKECQEKNIPPHEQDGVRALRFGRTFVLRSAADVRRSGTRLVKRGACSMHLSELSAVNLTGCAITCFNSPSGLEISRSPSPQTTPPTNPGQHNDRTHADPCLWPCIVLPCERAWGSRFVRECLHRHV